MENKGRKMLALGIVAMLCAVAIIGIGYAAFGGTARTYNQGNIATAGNILIENDGWTPMANSAAIEFDTYTYNAGVAYYFEGGVSINSLYAKAVGSEKVLDVTNNTPAAITSLTVGARSDAATSNGEFVYFFKVTVIDFSAAIPSDAGQRTAGVNLYYSTDGETFATATAEQIADQEHTSYIYYCAPIDVDYINLPAATTEQAVTVTSGTVAVGGSVSIMLQLYIGYAATCSVPDTFIGPVGLVGADNSIDAVTSATGPNNLSNVGFGFRIVDAS